MKKIAFALVTLAPLVTFAHPGHGETEGYSIIHYFTEPIHAVTVVAVAAVAYIVSRIVRKRKA